MTTNKRFKNVEENLEWGTVQYFTYHDEKITDKEIEKLVNHLLNQNEQLKKELKVYHEVASCGNCKYHNYDWYDDGDEFEVCDNGNDVTDGICKDWMEL